MPTVGFSMVNTISMTPKKVGKASNIFFIVVYFSSVVSVLLFLSPNIYSNYIPLEPMENYFSAEVPWIINYPVLSFSQKTST